MLISLEIFIKDTKLFCDNNKKLIIYNNDGCIFISTDLPNADKISRPGITWDHYIIIDNLQELQLIIFRDYGSHNESFTFVGDWNHSEIINYYCPATPLCE